MTPQELERAVAENAKAQKELAEKVVGEIKARTESFGDFPAFAAKMSAVEKKLADGVATEKQVTELKSAVTELQDAYKKFEPALKALAAGDADGDLTRYDNRYHNPLQQRHAPNAQAAKAMGLFMRAATAKGSVRDEVAKRLEDEFDLKVQHVEEIKERAASVHSEESGGIALPPELGQPIIEAMSSYGVVTSEATVETMSTPKKAFVKDGNDVDVYALEEGEELDEVDATYQLVQLEAKLWGAFTRWSSDFEEYGLTSVGEGWISRFSRAIAKKMDRAAFLGDGTAAYNNIVGILSSASVAAVSLPAGKTSFEDLTYDDLLGLIAAVSDEVYEEGGCKFFMSGSLTHVLKGVKDGVGRPMFNDAVTGAISQVIGEPIVRAAVMPRLTADAAATKFMAFGDLRRALKIGIKNQMTVLFSEHAYFTRAQNALRVLSRWGIQITEADAIKVLKTADA